MLQIVVNAVLVLQMLMPPGMCVCQLVPHSDTSTARPAARQASAPRRSCCGCCCKRASVSSSAHHGKGASKRTLAAPSSDCPGCPAFRNAEHFTVIEGANPLSLVLVALVQGPIVDVALAPPAIAAQVRETEARARPLFLTQRTLLI